MITINRIGDRQKRAISAIQKSKNRLKKCLYIYLWWQDLFSEFGYELLEEFVLAGGVVVVVGHDVAPDLNLFAHF